YDGNRSTFGDVSVAASAPDPDTLAVFAAERSSDGALTVMAVNKTATSASVALTIADFRASAASQVWQLTSSNTITRLADVTLSGQTLTSTLPAQSITLFVVPGSIGTLRPPTNVRIVP